MEYAHEEARTVTKEKGVFKGGIPNLDKYRIIIKNGVKF